MSQVDAHSTRLVGSDFQARLNRISRALSCEGVVIGLRIGDQVDYFVSNQSSNGAAAVSTFPVVLECLIKLLTAALVNKAIQQGAFEWGSKLRNLFGHQCERNDRDLGDISLKQLVEHTHGLDGSELVEAPMDNGGFIKSASLLEVLSNAEPLAPPGQLYNYSSVGYWLAAALLEQHYQRSYSDLLRYELASLGCASLTTADFSSREFSSTDHYCPALGGSLMLSIEDLLVFLGSQFADAPGSMFHGKSLSIEEKVVPLPGWNPTDIGMTLGWKCYGDGWFGHNAKSNDSNTLARVNPKLRQAIVISTKDQTATLMAAALFADALPEFKRLKMPALLKDTSALDLSSLSGVYGNCATAISISQASTGLHLRAYRVSRGLRAENAFFRAELRVAAGDIFLSHPMDPDQFAYLQFLIPGKHGPEYLWNGASVWRRQYVGTV